jgi:hypothetical protein
LLNYELDLTVNKAAATAIVIKTSEDLTDKLEPGVGS